MPVQLLYPVFPSRFLISTYQAISPASPGPHNAPFGVGQSELVFSSPLTDFCFFSILHRCCMMVFMANKRTFKSNKNMVYSCK
jgi:hypothetical protein